MIDRKAPRKKGRGRKPIMTADARLGLELIMALLDQVPVPMQHAPKFAAGQKWIDEYLAHYDSLAARRAVANEKTKVWRRDNPL